ncbi:hypothetical protein CNEO4_940055 [Clostridium neonatale]|nr:hypothetical protein CNEO4_680012 [Clostridium neonatale]CAI3727529.1 hypothetical protein CNEO4_940055 [Clostridium neonatale]CAI4141470.1 hypothetical protein CNEO4_710011 [Clostridium neonatale]
MKSEDISLLLLVLKNKYTNQLMHPPKAAKKRFFPLILNKTPKPNDAKNAKKD